MSQRDSGYECKERDLYETPEWVTLALIPHLPRPPQLGVWEPACGGGKMVNALGILDCQIDGTDISLNPEHDFLKADNAQNYDAIITNPPYELARLFIEKSLALMARDGFVAMLLRTDFDHAKTRQHLFSGCRAFAKKVVLTKRIKWFEDSNGQPSFNHAWFIWDWKHSGPPTLAYGP